MVDIKELQPQEIGEAGREAKGSVEVPTTPEQPVEVESWMEKIEKRFGRGTKASPADLQDDTQQTPPTSVPSQPPVILPITAQQMQQGKKLTIDFSLSWLVVWVGRQIKQLMRQKRRVLFKEE